MTDENRWQTARELAQICRKALNREVYNGTAPNDSNALTEVWPTALGAAFIIERHGRKYAVVLGPEEDITGDLTRPDYSSAE